MSHAMVNGSWTYISYGSRINFDISQLSNKVVKLDSLRLIGRATVTSVLDNSVWGPSPARPTVNVFYKDTGRNTSLITSYQKGTIDINVNLTSLLPKVSFIQDSIQSIWNEINFSNHPLGWNDSVTYQNNLVLEFTGTFENYAPLAPTFLSPTAPQSPVLSIRFSWIFNDVPGSPFKQTGSQLEYTESGKQPVTVNISGATNQYTMPANTFTAGSVSFRVRSSCNGVWGPWSSTASFTLTDASPLKPVLIYPLNVSVNGANGVLLEWRYNSSFDTFPTRFDIRYRLDGGNWITKTNNSSGSTPANNSVMTDPIVTQNRVEWQVQARGLTGTTGPWSDVGQFNTVGVPDAPVIVNVSNSNLPTVTFSASSIRSWELEVLQNNNIFYATGVRAFINEFTHKITRIIENGNYLARMRVTNVHGLNSAWGFLAFNIEAYAPEPLTLSITCNQRLFIRLHFNNAEEKTVYVYRSVTGKNEYLRIATLRQSVFDDYTVRPKQRYEYFVRVLNDEYNFADSNKVTGSVSFSETVIAEQDNPHKMIKFLYQLDNTPSKNVSFDFNKTLTNFIGRESPVLQIGSFSSKTANFAFFCKVSEYEKLENFHKNKKVLVLRDRRVGVIYGTIISQISVAMNTNPAYRDMCSISFSFVQTDHIEEVEL